MPRVVRSLQLTALVSLLALAGCAPSRVKIGGDVSLDGKALPKTMISLTPVDGKGRPCHGLSDDSGHFELMCDGKEGVPPGEYKVTFAATANTSIDTFKPDVNVDPAKRVQEFQDKARKDQEAARRRGEQIHANYV